ncbi:MAG: hypothetical protein WCB77_03060, partial [Pseudolabrys sp.]
MRGYRYVGRLSTTATALISASMGRLCASVLSVKTHTLALAERAKGEDSIAPLAKLPPDTLQTHRIPAVLALEAVGE